MMMMMRPSLSVFSAAAILVLLYTLPATTRAVSRRSGLQRERLSFFDSVTMGVKDGAMPAVTVAVAVAAARVLMEEEGWGIPEADTLFWVAGELAVMKEDAEGGQG